MNLKQSKLTEDRNDFIGKWHIYEMSMWDEDYFNMETQAYINIRPNNLGDFQFGLVTGSLDAYIEKLGKKERFNFTWEGYDEMNEASGSGWFELNDNNEIKGLIDFYVRVISNFQAKKV